MGALGQFLLRRAEDVMVLLAVAMFSAFIVQIFTRYVLNDPVAWPHEVIVITWLWLIFWGAAFFLADRDQVKFDVVYGSMPDRIRRGFALVVALAFVGFFLLSAPATWDFVSFKGIRGTDHFRIPLSWVFSVYLVFLAGTVVRYAWRAVRLVRGDRMSEIEKS